MYWKALRFNYHKGPEIKDVTNKSTNGFAGDIQSILNDK